MKPKWTVEYENDTGPCDEGFAQWWSVTDGEMSFDSSDELNANWLCDLLNAVESFAAKKKP